MSSTKANYGSSHRDHSSISEQGRLPDTGRERLLDRYERDERDHKSLAVAQYDAYQADARKRHEEELRNMVGRPW